jgi:N6-L-threonylcarbamoyladenine synthase
MKVGHKLPNWLYQKGPLYGEENIKAYVRKRDNYTCQYCGQDLHGKRCEVDHIKPKSRGGTNVPDNMVACCEDCNKSKDNQTLDEWIKLLEIAPTEINKIRLRRIPRIKEQVKKSLIEAAHVQSMKRALVRELNDLYQVEETNGVATKLIRESINLPKTHYNDAVAIALGEPKEIVPFNVIYLIRQVRKKKRSLHEATPRKGRNKPNKEAKRNRKNIKEIVVNGKRWCLWDKVYIPQKDVIGYITGFTGNYVYIQDMNGYYIRLSSKYKQVNPKEMKLICRNNNYITESVALSSLQ